MEEEAEGVGPRPLGDPVHLLDLLVMCPRNMLFLGLLVMLLTIKESSREGGYEAVQLLGMACGL